MKLSEEILKQFEKGGEFTKVEIETFRNKLADNMLDDDKINRVEIIIMKYKDPDSEKKCIEKIIDHTHHPYKLNVFDNRLNTGNTSKAWNKLIDEATCDLVCIMDSDAFVTDGWLSPLIEGIKHEKCVMSVPVMGASAATPDQGMAFGPHPSVEARGHVSGFCFLISRKKFKKVGKFIEDFYIFGQDSEMCDRISNLGYDIRVCRASLVYHGEEGRDGNWSFSRSTRKASLDGEFNWSLDTRYASILAQLKRFEFDKRQDLIDSYIKNGQT
jgi:GT2 family glycosyltransferase